MNPFQDDKDEVEELMRRANSNIMDIVVGVVDTGICPESPSFTDAGMGPIPQTWKGICQVGVEFQTTDCNKKLIGARYFVAAYEATYGQVNPAVEYRSPRDMDGHGTHVASVATGRVIGNAAAAGGFGLGTVQGSDARLAIYKACWVKPPPESTTGCKTADVFAAIDAAIDDGVDVINLSHGKIQEYTADANAVRSLQAAKFDIAVAAAAGNFGPEAGTVANVALWMITVAGQSITPQPQTQSFELVYTGNIEIPGSTTPETTGQCPPGTLSPKGAGGRAVVCLRGIEYPPPIGQVYTWQQALEIQRAGGAAALLHNLHNGIGVSLKPFPIPTVVVLAADMNSIGTYIQSTPNPTVTLYPPTTVQPTNPSSIHGRVFIHRTKYHPIQPSKGASRHNLIYLPTNCLTPSLIL
ncbi:subtilisin-like protease SBT5.6 [Andrographis paniculata]|uniref:subtilisin-like protease SBT5.6 n=1 Tax=Andrographis paniculata TaxID=175694 RepID=UPI0021E6FAD9|nr:subtilisin-like protease SBT5.6 [Andrographis paniculata]